MSLKAAQSKHIDECSHFPLHRSFSIGEAIFVQLWQWPDPRLDSLIKLAGALQVEPAELIEGLHFEPAAQRGEFKIAPAKKSG